MTQTQATTTVPIGRPRTGYIPALDGLRAVAVAGVFFTHADVTRFAGGGLGVDVFFVLSGFLITANLMREYARSGGIRLKSFYLRRLIRLYPALLLAVCVLAIPGLIYAPLTRYFVFDVLLALTYLTFIVAEIGLNVSKMWGHTWTLSIEEMFYLIWPVGLIFLMKVRSLRRYAGVVATTVGFAMILAGIFIEVAGMTPTGFLRPGGLFLGCGLAIALCRRPKAQGRSFWAWAGLVLVLAGFVLGSVPLQPILVPNMFPVMLTCIGTLLMVAAFATGRGGFLGKVLASKPLTYVGTISYELYLWHYAVLVLLTWITGQTALELVWAWVPLSFALAAGTHAILTPWINRWKSRIG